MTYRTVTPRSLTAAGVLALSLAALAVLCVARGIPAADALVYRAEGAAVVDGTDVYGFTVTGRQLPAAHPPFAAILFVPTTWLPVGALKVVLVAGNAALLALFVRLSQRFAGLPAERNARRSPGRPTERPPGPFAGPVPLLAPVAVAVAVAFGLWLEPVFQTVLFGQVTLALACLVLWDLSRPEHALGKGFALGIAAGVTLTPAVFIGYLLLTGRVRSGLTALASLTGTVLLGALVLPAASGEFWTRRVFEAGRAGETWIVDNQSLRGLFARVLHTPDPGAVWAVAALVTAVCGLWAARRAFVRAGSEPWGVLAAALTALLVSPVSWSHHWVWCVPLLAVLIAEARFRTAVTVGVVWTARSFWAVPHGGALELRLAWWQQPLASPYALAAVGLLAVTAWRTRAGTTAGAGTGGSRPPAEASTAGQALAARRLRPQLSELSAD
ncbi:glycosyltransferase 87 family protein [Streptomyces sp. NPDC088116]|uniref:glycosyltransferase 87 family protein n=1 Tax=Streptomyces sp. NPDC088116 TaxID=3365825 RepID=UPI0038049C8B